MSSATAKPILIDKVNALLENQEDLFLVQIKVDAKNNIKVYLDGDKGITIGQCTLITKALYPFIEENGLFPNDDFSLEVSSAGVDEPIILQRQYVKNIGRNIEIVLEGGTKMEGLLQTVEDASLSLEVKEGKGKKAIVKQEIIELKNIKTAIVQVKF